MSERDTNTHCVVRLNGEESETERTFQYLGSVVTRRERSMDELHEENIRCTESNDGTQSCEYEDEEAAI